MGLLYQSYQLRSALSEIVSLVSMQHLVSSLTSLSLTVSQQQQQQQKYGLPETNLMGGL